MPRRKDAHDWYDERRLTECTANDRDDDAADRTGAAAPDGGRGDNGGGERGEAGTVATMGLVDVARAAADGTRCLAREEGKEDPKSGDQANEGPAEPDRQPWPAAPPRGRPTPAAGHGAAA